MRTIPYSILAAWCALLAGCGTGSMDLAGYPDKEHDRLYENGRLGGDKGYAAFDLRRAWQSATE